MLTLYYIGTRYEIRTVLDQIRAQITENKVDAHKKN